MRTPASLDGNAGTSLVGLPDAPDLSRRTFLRYVALTGAAVGLADILAACGAGSSPSALASLAPGASLAPSAAALLNMDFGLVFPLSGSNAAFVSDQVTSALMSVEALNATPPFPGITLKAHSEDSASDPRVGTVAFNKATSVDGVPVVISAVSSVVGAIAPLAERAQVLQISVGASDPKIATYGRYTISSYPLSNVDVTAIANYLYKTKGFKKAAVLYINNATGIYAEKVFRNVFTKAGGEVVTSQTHEPSATDYTAQITNIRNANVDVLYVQSLGGEWPLIVKQARQLGYNAQIASYTQAESQALLTTAGSAAEGIIYTALVPPYSQPSVQKFLDELKAKVGRDPNGFPYCMYLHDAPYILAEAGDYLRKNGKAYTGSNVRDAITTIGTFNTPLTGDTTFAADGTVVKPVSIKMVQGGKFVFVGDPIKPGSDLLPMDELSNPLG